MNLRRENLFRSSRQKAYQPKLISGALFNLEGVDPEFRDGLLHGCFYLQKRWRKTHCVAAAFIVETHYKYLHASSPRHGKVIEKVVYRRSVIDD